MGNVSCVPVSSRVRADALCQPSKWKTACQEAKLSPARLRDSGPFDK
jgi:hypothetical protein